MSERFYCPDVAEGAGPELGLVGDEARHLIRVRRVLVGEVVELFNGQGFATRAEVTRLSKGRVALRPFGPPLPDRAPALALTLATAVPKGERFDWLVEKATELGVARLVPVLAERSAVDPREAKLERLRRTVVEACKQCGRNRLMTIERTKAWADVLGDSPVEELRLLAHPGGRSFADWPRPRVESSAVLAIGPEGGFTGGEVEAAKAAGWLTVGLGSTLLRIETAGLTACARMLALGEIAIEEERSVT